MRDLLAVLIRGVMAFALLFLVMGVLSQQLAMAWVSAEILILGFVGLYFTGTKARAEKRRHEAAKRAKDEYWLRKGRK